MSKRSTRAIYNAYMREYMLRRYHERRNALVNALGHRCMRCGDVDGPFDFDHIDKNTKAWEIADRLHTAPAEVMALELTKIQLLCKPCHRLKTTLERGQQPAAHGSITMYTHHRCRCEPCRR